MCSCCKIEFNYEQVTLVFLKGGESMILLFSLILILIAKKYLKKKKNWSNLASEHSKMSKIGKYTLVSAKKI